MSERAYTDRMGVAPPLWSVDPWVVVCTVGTSYTTWARVPSSSTGVAKASSGVWGRGRAEYVSIKEKEYSPLYEQGRMPSCNALMMKQMIITLNMAVFDCDR